MPGRARARAGGCLARPAMSAYEIREEETAGRTEPHTEPDTEHVEPVGQGGARFVRCSGCGREMLSSDVDEMPFHHAPGCDITAEVRR